MKRIIFFLVLLILLFMASCDPACIQFSVNVELYGYDSEEQSVMLIYGHSLFHVELKKQGEVYVGRADVRGLGTGDYSKINIESIHGLSLFLEAEDCFCIMSETENEFKKITYSSDDITEITEEGSLYRQYKVVLNYYKQQACAS